MTNTKTLSAIALDFLANPFRLFFLLAAASLIPIACAWLSVGLSPYLGWSILSLGVDPLSFHAFGFLNVFGAAAFAGFIMTAVPEWTHFTYSLRKLSSFCLLLWCISFALSFFNLQYSAWLMTIFWLSLTTFTVIASAQDRNSRQISVCLMLATIFILNVAYAYTGKWSFIVALAHSYMLGVLLIIFRIGMAMGNRSLEQAGAAAEHLSYAQNPYYKNLNLICMYLYIASLLFFDDVIFSSWLALAVGFSTLARLMDWHHLILWHASFVRWHYLTLLCIGVGYSWLGLSHIIGLGNHTQALHLIFIGGFILMAMQVFNIAGLLHSGCELPFPRSSQWALGAIILAALLRALSLSLGLNYGLFALVIPNLLLIMAFAVYIPVFWRIFIRHDAIQPSPRN